MLLSSLLLFLWTQNQMLCFSQFIVVETCLSQKRSVSLVPLVICFCATVVILCLYYESCLYSDCVYSIFRGMWNICKHLIFILKENKILFPPQTRSFRGIRFYILLMHSNSVARGPVFLQNLLQLRVHLNICQCVQWEKSRALKKKKKLPSLAHYSHHFKLSTDSRIMVTRPLFSSHLDMVPTSFVVK